MIASSCGLLENGRPPAKRPFLGLHGQPDQRSSKQHAPLFEGCLPQRRYIDLAHMRVIGRHGEARDLPAHNRCLTAAHYRGQQPERPAWQGTGRLHRGTGRADPPDYQLPELIVESAEEYVQIDATCGRCL